MRNDTRAAKYKPHLAGKTLAISFMTVAEMLEGALRKNWPPTKLAALQAEFRKYVVIPSSFAVCEHWAQIRAERASQTISVDDAWIAATARAHGCALVTHNPSDFANIENLAIITA